MISRSNHGTVTEMSLLSLLGRTALVSGKDVGYNNNINKNNTNNSNSNNKQK